MAAFSAFASPPTAAADNISGLREQILANAAVLLPQIVGNSASFAETGLNGPDTFQVITIYNSLNNQHRSQLLHGPLLSRRIAAQGAPGTTAEQALRNLLTTTSEALGWYHETLLGKIEHEHDCAGGSINVHMVEEGFNYSAYERFLEAQREGRQM